MLKGLQLKTTMIATNSIHVTESCHAVIKGYYYITIAHIVAIKYGMRAYIYFMTGTRVIHSYD